MKIQILRGGERVSSKADIILQIKNNLPNSNEFCQLILGGYFKSG